MQLKRGVSWAVPRSPWQWARSGGLRLTSSARQTEPGWALWVQTHSSPCSASELGLSKLCCKPHCVLLFPWFPSPTLASLICETRPRGILFQPKAAQAWRHHALRDVWSSLGRRGLFKGKPASPGFGFLQCSAASHLCFTCRCLLEGLTAGRKVRVLLF